MKAILKLLCAAGVVTTLAGCVGFVPVHEPPPAAVVVHPAPPVLVHPAPAVVYRPAPPPRGWRDRDGDGVPNRYDRRPNNPYRY